MKASLALLLALACAGAGAQTVSLQGMLGARALLIVGGGAPKFVAPGETHQGVKVISTAGDQAVVEVGGSRLTLRMGDAPASVGAGGGPVQRGSVVVLTAGAGGHFLSQGAINGRAVQFMVDTGASAVGVGQAEADRLGIDYRKGRPVNVGTSNGVVQGWLVKLALVRIGDVEVRDVDAVVSPAAMPYVLLGNTFLSRFRMKRDNEQMVLEKRY